MQKKDRIIIPFEIKADSMREDDNNFYIKGYGSVFGNVDQGRDVVKQGAFGKTIQKGQSVKMLWQHDADMPIGIWTSIQEDSYGLLMEGRLPKEDTFVSGRVIPQLKNGSLDGLSIGFCVRDYEIDSNNSVRIIKEADLMEVSIVTFPMNQSAAIHSIKAAVSYQGLPIADSDLEWDSTAAVKRIRDFTKSLEAPSRDYRKAFLWFDNDAADSFGGYKMPIADVIDGKLVVIPRAVFAAAAAINGARGGIDIPEADIAAVKRTIERYYDDMDRDSPFVKAYNLEQVIDIKTKRDFERLLRDSGVFSRKAALHLANNWNMPTEERRESVDEKSLSSDLKELLSVLKSTNRKS